MRFFADRENLLDQMIYAADPVTEVEKNRASSKGTEEWLCRLSGLRGDYANVLQTVSIAQLLICSPHGRISSIERLWRSSALDSGRRSIALGFTAFGGDELSDAVLRKLRYVENETTDTSPWWVPESQLDLFQEASNAGRPFEPSAYLIRIVDQGLREYISKLNHAEEREALTSAFQSLDSISAKREHFLEVLLDAFAKISFLQLDGIYEREPVTKGGVFNLHFQNEFLDSYPIVPNELDRFQSRLRSELVLYLRTGGEISGGWGELKACEDDLVVEYAYPVSDGVTGDDWQLATLIEGGDVHDSR